MKSLTVFKVLDASTAHLSRQTIALLEANRLNGALYYPKSVYGWFVHVPEKADFEAQPELPADLLTCIEFAQGQDLDWIMFDRDGSVVEGLRVYEEGEEEQRQTIATAYAAMLTRVHGHQIAGSITADGNIRVASTDCHTFVEEVAPETAMARAFTPLPILEEGDLLRQTS